jgi:hypothetical protein
MGEYDPKSIMRANIAARRPGVRAAALRLVAAVAVVALGLLSRRYAAYLPAFLAAYAGDTLWALMLFLGIGAVVPAWPTRRTAAVTMAACFLVELSQLYHAPWIEDVRHTRLGGLVLGYGFLWSDLACYTAGVAAGAALDAGVRRVTWRRAQSSRSRSSSPGSTPRTRS